MEEDLSNDSESPIDAEIGNHEDLSGDELPRGNEMNIVQDGGFVCKLSLAYGNNISEESGNLPYGEMASLALDPEGWTPPLNVGDICYPIANIALGLNSFKAANGFIYDPHGGTIEYKISGTTLNPSWSGP